MLHWYSWTYAEIFQLPGTMGIVSSVNEFCERSEMIRHALHVFQRLWIHRNANTHVPEFLECLWISMHLNTFMECQGTHIIWTNHTAPGIHARLLNFSESLKSEWLFLNKAHNFKEFYNSKTSWMFEAFWLFQAIDVAVLLYYTVGLL